jgi:hypothetical protein
MKSFALLILITSISSEQFTYTTNKLWKDYERPEWAEEVKITYDDDMKHIQSVEGIIIPLSTNDRPKKSPSPYNDCGTGRNNITTGVDYQLDKGHIMALSNGGPDISLNIVPQKDKWQEYGEWRKLEIKIRELALNEYNWDSKKLPQIEELEDYNPEDKVVSWKINIIYKNQCGMKPIECKCQPIEYKGDVYTKDKHYHFEIVNDKDYTWGEITPESSKNHINYLLIIIPCVIILIIVSLIFVYLYKIRNIQRMRYIELEENIGLDFV